MPKRYHKKMRGGFWESWWNSTKKATSDAYNSVTATKTSTPTTISPTTTPISNTITPTTTPISNTITPSSTALPASTEYTPQETVGGRKRRTRSKRGGFNARTPTSGIAFHASPISDIKNAQPHNWVGGRTKKHRKHKHSKSCKHKKH